MEDNRQERIIRLEQEILAELEKKRAIIIPWPRIPFSVEITKVMNCLRKWQSQFFTPGTSRAGQKGDKKLLSPEEASSYDSFDVCRSEYRALNYHYTDQYRGGYMLNYNFAVLAVSLAVLSIWLLHFESKDFVSEHVFYITVFLIVLAKFILLLLILVNTRQANGTEFNHRAITVRYAMEQFRCMCYLSLLDIRTLPEMPDAKYLSRKWKNNYLDQFVRRRIKGVFEQLDLDTDNYPHKTDFNEHLPALLEFIQTDWIKQQIDYQK